MTRKQKRGALGAGSRPDGVEAGSESTFEFIGAHGSGS